MNKIKEYAMNNSVPIIQDAGLHFILETIKNRSIKTILELGTAIGYSSIMMAKLNDEIRIDTIEKNEELFDQALLNIESEGLSSQIRCSLQAIEDYKTDSLYDMIFIDAAKAQYGKYLEQFLANLASNGCIIFDNLEFHGMVDNPELTKSKKTKQLVGKIRQFRDTILLDKRFNIYYYPNIGDGILLLERKDEQNEI